MAEIKLKKINDYEWEIPKTGKMNVPVKIFASDKLIEKMKEDETFKQAMNTTQLKGIVKNMIVCPDGHMGYGLPIGGVAAFDADNGIITPGGVGFDINCGIRVLATNLTKKDILSKKKEILHQISRDVPKGIGKGSVVNLDNKQIKEILETGAQWAVKNGYGIKEDLDKTEDYGCIEGANAKDVSQRAIARGLPQLGSLGSGNHI